MSPSRLALPLFLLISSLDASALAQDTLVQDSPSEDSLSLDGGVSDEGTEVTPGDDGGSDLRIGIQGRFSALNVVLAGGSEAGDQVPFATLGVRVLDERLFAGLGFGFFGVEGSNSGFSFSPLATFDLYQDDDLGAFYAGLWLNLANFDNDLAMADDDTFVWGLTAVLGARARVLDALGIGAEWGWGFLNLSREGSAFVHGFVGNLLVEVTFGV